MRTPIPSARALGPPLSNILEAIRENVEKTNGTRSGTTPIASLATTATTAQIISKINEIIDRLQT